MDPFHNSNIDDICFRTAYGEFLGLLSTQHGLSPEVANMLYMVVRMDLRNNPQFKNIFGNATQERKLLNYVKSYATEQRHLFRKHIRNSLGYSGEKKILTLSATVDNVKRCFLKDKEITQEFVGLIALLRSIAREIEERKSDDGGRKPKEPHWWEMVSELLQRAEMEKGLGKDRRSSRWSNFIKSITDKESMATSLSPPSTHPQSPLFSPQIPAYTSEYSAVSSVAGPSNLPHMAFNASFATGGSLPAAPNHWIPWSYH
ncbi:hypothetical protein M422DRAFT_44621 [Sphaerobolus stellatus SS14]|nr:hypothetical protein M422DRAFT_44621 [Sphaerobolus stellatus SS14]